MTARASLLYLNAKIQREIYITDMLLYTARGFVAKPEGLPRYYDIIRPRKAAAKSDYTAQDVVDMFRGKGKLA